MSCGNFHGMIQSSEELKFGRHIESLGLSPPVPITEYNQLAKLIL